MKLFKTATSEFDKLNTDVKKCVARLVSYREFLAYKDMVKPTSVFAVAEYRPLDIIGELSVICKLKHVKDNTDIYIRADLFDGDVRSYSVVIEGEKDTAYVNNLDDAYEYIIDWSKKKKIGETNER